MRAPFQSLGQKLAYVNVGKYSETGQRKSTVPSSGRSSRMSLPSSQRPRELNDPPMVNPGTSSSLLTLKVDKNQIFMSSMIDWHQNKLNKSQRADLTKKRVIRYATTVAYRLSIPYKHLPDKWLKILHEEHGVWFKCSRKREKREVYKSREDLTMKIFERKCIDLSNEPPPPEWIAAYTTGKAKPRILKCYKNSAGVTVIYYDYDAELSYNDGTPVDSFAHVPTDRDGIFPSIQ